MTLDALLQSWIEDGLIEKSGLTVFSGEELFARFRSIELEDAARYLSLIIASGIDCHATSAEVGKSSSRLVVRLPGAYLDKPDIQQSLSTLFKARPARGSDLILGLLMAQTFLAEQSVLEVVHPQLPSYRWLSSRPEAFQKMESGPSHMLLKVDFEVSWLEALQSWLESLHQPESSPECLLLESLCRYSSIPISIEGQRITTTYSLAGAPIAVSIGEPLKLEDYKGKLLFEPVAPWRGVVALEPGEIQFVVRGLMIEGSCGLNLRGLVFADNLSLDPSRTQILPDDAYRSLLEGLKRQRDRMLREVDICKESFEWGKQMHELFLRAEIYQLLPQPAIARVVSWLEFIPQGDDTKKQVAQLNFLYWAAEKYNELGMPQEREVAAEMGYQRVRLLFDSISSVKLADMCAQLCRWLAARRGEAYGWELLAASKALRKGQEGLMNRLEALYGNPIGKFGKCLLSLGLSVLARKTKQYQLGREFRSRANEEMRRLSSRLERAEIEDISSQDTETILAILAGKLYYLALYDDEVRKAMGEPG